MATCALCGTEAELCRSHIFSEFLLEDCYDSDGTYISISSHPLHRPRPFQIGPRERLLCKKCETKLSQWETPSARLLRGLREKERDGRLVVEPDYDYASFRLFGLSLIWRAHIAEKYGFDDVDLGPHGEVIRRMLYEERPGDWDTYPFALVRVDGSEHASRIASTPNHMRYQGLHCWMFFAHGFIWIYVISHEAHKVVQNQPFVGAREELVVMVDLKDEKDFLRELARRAPL